MAGFAGCKNPAMVETCAYPAFRGVAIITYIAARNVLGMLAGCAAPVMAQIAFKRCALEQAAYMTAGAVQEAVFAGQRKSRGEVIETFYVFSSMCYRADYDE
jgi:hypothetical protein